MENLTHEQKDTIRPLISNMKFVEIAQRAGCTKEQVRQFAGVVFAERKAAEQARYETEQQRIRDLQAGIDELIAQGKITKARDMWYEHFAGDVDTSDIEERNQEVYNDIRNGFLEDHEQEIQDAFYEAISDEIDEAKEEAWQEYLDDTRSGK
jgi:hypothetical protein